MVFLNIQDITLPLQNPVIIFSLVLFIILFAPILFNKIKVPHIIGLILAGVIIGPYGLNFLLRDSSIVLFGTVGLLYIMFTAGLEIDLDEFIRKKGIPFIFFSTSAMSSIVREAFSMSVQGFFLKAQSLDELEKTLSTIFDYWARCEHP